MTRRIALLGTLSIEEDGKPLRILNSAKGCALLAFLLVEGGHQQRERIADLLWDSTTRNSLQSLRELLKRVRRELPEVKATRHTVTFEPAPETFVDLISLRAALQSANLAVQDDALRLYTGDLLAGFHIDNAPEFERWLQFAAERLHTQVLTAYRNLCEQYAIQTEWQNGLAAAQRWQQLDPVSEEATRQMMRFSAEIRTLTTLRQAYQTHKQALDETLQIAPSAEIQQTFAQLEQQLTSQRTPSLPTDQLPAPASLPSNSVVPFLRNRDFVGREETLLSIARAFEQSAERAPVVVLTGMGGIGKTQIAVEFAYRFGSYFAGVYWLEFSDPEMIAEQVAQIGGGRGMGLYTENDVLPLTEQVARVQRAWQEPTRRLLIFDNCQDEAVLKAWLPVTGGSHVLVTSQRGEWARALDVVIRPINTLARPASIMLLRQIALRLNDENAANVAAELGDLPLALHLAGSYLGRYKTVTTASYLTQLRSQDGLNHPSLQGRGTRISPTDHALHVAETLRVSLARLGVDDEPARRLLAQIACCALGEPLPQAFVLRLIDDDVTAQDALDRLHQLGLIALVDEQTVLLHRLIATFVRQEETISCATVQTAMIEQLAEHERHNHTLVPLPFAAVHLKAVARSSLEVGQPNASILVGYWARYLTETDRARQFEPLADQAIERLTRDVGLQGVERADALARIGDVLLVIGRSEQAHTLYQEKLILRQKLYPPIHRKLADSHTSFGLYHLFRGEMAQSRTHWAAAIDIFEQLPQREQTSIRHAYAQLYMGGTFLAVGEYAAARPFVTQALALYQRTLPAQHPELGFAYGTNGVVAYWLENYASARDHFQRAHDIYAAAFGAESGRTAAEKINLGATLAELDRPSEARDWLTRGLTLLERLVPEGAAVAFGNYALGKLAARQNEQERALQYLQRAVDLYEGETRNSGAADNARALLANLE